MGKKVKYKKSVYLMQKFQPNTVAPDKKEIQKMLEELSNSEISLYIEVKFMALEDPHPLEFSNKNLSERLNKTEATIAKAKTALKQKGWMIIKTFKDYNGNSRADIYMGKEQVALYNKGISLEIVSPAHYEKYADMFQLNEPNITEEESVKRVTEFNEFCKDL